eukprot:TRINITY_DN11154_c0_g1_i1.p1 TRINITY_DN11154_c0_g1~~TRINITY_DN11154_c0_g1_i1.p1  ORF type:complete len:539 (+),score=55.13 TRINITY_DN11154_c0_g1_i1:88-1704(+)
MEKPGVCLACHKSAILTSHDIRVYEHFGVPYPPGFDPNLSQHSSDEDSEPQEPLPEVFCLQCSRIAYNRSQRGRTRIRHTVKQLIRHLDALKVGSLPEAVARRFARELELRWFSHFGNKEMQKLMWYMVVHEQSIGAFIDGYDVSGTAHDFMTAVDDSLQLEKEITRAHTRLHPLDPIDMQPYITPATISAISGNRSSVSKPHKKRVRPEPSIEDEVSNEFEVGSSADESELPPFKMLKRSSPSVPAVPPSVDKVPNGVDAMEVDKSGVQVIKVEEGVAEDSVSPAPVEVALQKETLATETPNEIPEVKKHVVETENPRAQTKSSPTSPDEQSASSLLTSEKLFQKLGSDPTLQLPKRRRKPVHRGLGQAKPFPQASLKCDSCGLVFPNETEIDLHIQKTFPGHTLEDVPPNAMPSKNKSRAPTRFVGSRRGAPKKPKVSPKKGNEKKGKRPWRPGHDAFVKMVNQSLIPVGGLVFCKQSVGCVTSTGSVLSDSKIYTIDQWSKFLGCKERAWDTVTYMEKNLDYWLDMYTSTLESGK